MQGAFGKLEKGDTRTEAPPRVAVWAGREQASLVAAVAARADVELVAVCAAEPTHATAITGEFPGLGLDDPRDLGAAGADLVWLAADLEFPPDSRRALSGLPILCSTSPLSSLAEMSEWATQCRLAPSCTSALALIDPELLGHFGAVTSGVVHLAAPDAAGGLGARLLDLASLAFAWLGLPESVSAAHTGGAARSSASPSLRGLLGTMAVQLRFAEGRSITALLESAERWRRLVRLIGPSGELSLDGGAFVWRGPTDEVIEQSTLIESRPVGRVRAKAAVDISATDATARAIAAVMRSPHCRHALRPEAYAIAEAARLSRLTGQPESPANLLAALTSPGVVRSG